MSGHTAKEEAVCDLVVSMETWLSFLKASFVTYSDPNNSLTVRSGFSKQPILDGKGFKSCQMQLGPGRETLSPLLTHWGSKSICCSFRESKTHVNPQGAGGPLQRTQIQCRWLLCHSVLKCQAYLCSSTHWPGCPGRTGTPRSPEPSWQML